MDDSIVVCSHCGAKLRLKPAARKVMKEVKCGKCRQPISLAPAQGDAAKAAPVSAAPPVPAPKPAAPPAPTAPSTAPAPSVSTQPTAAPAKEVAAKPEVQQKPQAPAPVPVSAPKPETAAAAPTPGAAPRDTGQLENRLKKLETDMAGLKDLIKDLCRLQAESGKAHSGEMEKLAGRL